MSNLTEEQKSAQSEVRQRNKGEKEKQKTALDEFKQINFVLAVPTVAKPIPPDRRWQLPDPAKASLPLPDMVQRNVGQAPTRYEESKADEPYNEDSRNQTRRK